MADRSVLRALLSALACAGVALAVPFASAHEPPRTEFEESDGAEWTSHEGELAFLAAVDEDSDRVEVSVIGTTEEGRPLHLVRIGHPRPREAAAALSRPVEMHVCTQHGNEPAGREACLIAIRDLAFTEDETLVGQLSEQTLLFVPTANPDGREANTRGNSAGVDINRDHLNLVSPEAQAMAAVVRDWQPDLSLDHHEYGPGVPGVYDDDLLYLWPRNLNVDAEIRSLGVEYSKDFLAPCASEAGYTSDEYGLYAAGPVDVTQTAGDGDEGIARNAFGLRHGIGILVESAVSADYTNLPAEATTPGVQLRRVASHRAVIDCTLAFMRENAARVTAATSTAPVRKTAEGLARSEPVYFQGQDEDTTVAKDAPETVSAEPPCGYALTTAQVAEMREVFALHAIQVLPHANGGWVPLGQPAEPVIPLLLDERNADRYAVEGTPLDACPAAAPPAPPPVPRPRPNPPAAPAPGQPRLPATGPDALLAWIALLAVAASLRARRATRG